MSNKIENPRKIRNFLLSPDIQLAFALNIVALSVFFVIGIAFVIYFQLGDFIQTILTLSDFDTKTLSQLQGDWDATALWLGIFMGSYVFITAILCVIYTHRMIGPTIAFKRQINDLMNENYASRVNLREGDAFEDVAELLNSLGDSLERKHKYSDDTKKQNKELHENAS